MSECGWLSLDTADSLTQQDCHTRHIDWCMTELEKEGREKESRGEDRGKRVEERMSGQGGD